MWVWIFLGLLLIAIVALGIKIFGGDDDTTDGDAATSVDAPTTGTN